MTPSDIRPCDSCGGLVIRPGAVAYRLTLLIQPVTLDGPAGPDAQADLILCRGCAESRPTTLDLAGIVHATTRPSS